MFSIVTGCGCGCGKMSVPRGIAISNIRNMVRLSSASGIIGCLLLPNSSRCGGISLNHSGALSVVFSHSTGSLGTACVRQCVRFAGTVSESPLFSLPRLRSVIGSRDPSFVGRSISSLFRSIESSGLFLGCESSVGCIGNASSGVQ
jgi:hypothetical protein